MPRKKSENTGTTPRKPKSSKKYMLEDLSLSDLKVFNSLIESCIASYNRQLGQAAYLDPDSAISMIEPIQRDILVKRNKYEKFHTKVRREIERLIEEYIESEENGENKG